MIDLTKKTGFECIPEDLQKISELMIADDKLSKLLFYTDKRCFNNPELNTEEKVNLIKEEYIQIIPSIKVADDNRIKSYINLNFDQFTPNETNSQYINGLLMIDILCHKDVWKIINREGKISLRPYEIANRIMKICDNKKFEGIGKMQFTHGEQTMLATDTNYMGLTLKFLFVNSRF